MTHTHSRSRLSAVVGGAWRRVHAMVVAIVLLPVAIYRAVLSPLKRTPTCRYLPTCSEYAVTAVRERGIVVGGALATWRILRCNPLCHGGYDPVPCKHGGSTSCVLSARRGGPPSVRGMAADQGPCDSLGRRA